MNLGLGGKAFVVVGGTRGIGLQVVESILEEGGKAIIIARDQLVLSETTSRLIARFGKQSCYGFSADSSNQKQIAEVREKILAIGIQIYGLVLNVGSGEGSAEPFPPSEVWEQSWRTNFVSSLVPARELFPLLSNEQSSIVLVGSIAGADVVGAPIEYATSKAAQIALTKNLAKKLAPDVRVNMVMPGNVMTKDGVWARKMAASPEDTLSMIHGRVPLKRFGSPREIASAIIFLLSEISAFTTGAVLRVDGGQSVGTE